MLSVRCLRAVSASQGALLSLSVCKKVKYPVVCCVSSACYHNIHNKDTWLHHNFTTSGNRIELIHSINRRGTFRNCCTTQEKLSCWNCHMVLDQTPSFFCMNCKVVQPIDEERTSYFKIMDCDHTFTLDTQKLQRRYLQLQRILHPDNFSQKSTREQEYSESQSALVNKAYTTLLKPLSRGLYMLELAGMRIDEGTDSAADSNFLMELMEINEALDEAQTPEEASKIGQETKGKLAELTEQIEAALCKGELQAAKGLLAQMKYYVNIEEKVKDKLSEFM